MRDGHNATNHTRPQGWCHLILLFFPAADRELDSRVFLRKGIARRTPAITFHSAVADRCRQLFVGDVGVAKLSLAESFSCWRVAARSRSTRLGLFTIPDLAVGDR
jgi:hypothetical protein